MQTEHSVISVAGLRFTVLAEGPSSGPLVLLLHGFPQFADSWLPIMRPIADAGFRAVAVDQRGYSTGARPAAVSDYALDHLLTDVDGFARVLGASRFHLVGHDWGGFLAWHFAARHPQALYSLAVVSTPHPQAWHDAIRADEDQKRRSAYIALFKAPGNAAEQLFAAQDYQQLRSAYQGKLTQSAVEGNVRRLSEPGALTAALNWYRALDTYKPVPAGPVTVPTLYVWGTDDLALGETAALQTARYVSAPYGFERLEGRSHWLLDEIPSQVAGLILDHLRANQPS